MYQTYNAQYPAGLSIYGAFYGGQNVAQHTKLVKAKAYYKKNGKKGYKNIKEKNGENITLL